MLRQLGGLLVLTLTALDAQAHEQVRKLENANHVFNAIHSSMRQWGSSLSPGHNGMSFFVATVPKGQQFYHGTASSQRFNGTEWLAFEPEHALQFAHPRRRPPPGRGGPPRQHDEGWHTPERTEESFDHPPWHSELPKHELKARHPHDDRPLTQTAAQRARADSRQQQIPLNAPEGPPQEPKPGYLHTYRTKRDLRLLYIDGESAAKTDKGTLDTQDIVLLHDCPPPQQESDYPHSQPRQNSGFKDNKEPFPSGGWSEAHRANKLCEMAETEWKGTIDGILRMEMGFEIILCSFERDLEVERITQVQNGSGGGGFEPGRGDDASSLAYYQAVASRFDGIGGDRVRINYDHFVTLYTYPKAFYFNDLGLPRVRNDTQTLSPIRTAITNMILHASDPADSTHWQSITDLVVARYSDRLEHLTSDALTSIQAFQQILLATLRPFIDFSAPRNSTLETSRCATQYLPSLPTPAPLAAHALWSVTSTICDRLVVASQMDDLVEATRTLGDLKKWLGWSTWKRCRGCSYDEVCFVPIWPVGGKEQMREPRCVASDQEFGRGYWRDLKPWRS